MLTLLTRSIPDEVGYGPNNETDTRGGEFYVQYYDVFVSFFIFLEKDVLPKYFYAQDLKLSLN